MHSSPPSWLSLIPPLLAIVMAMATRRVLLSLFAGVFAGALIVCSGNPVLAVAQTMERYLWPSLSDPDHIRVFTFTLLMGAMVGVMQHSRGMEGLVSKLAPLARSRRGGQLTVWFLGLVVFFDDYANSLLLGTTMRPLADRLRISREKLAYLVDSTAAPVSGLAVISTWIAGEIGYIRDGYDQLNLVQPVDGFEVFITTIPYRFYVLWALLFVPLVALLGRDFGPMWAAERRCRQRRSPADREDYAEGAALDGRYWFNAVIPVLITVVVTLFLILLTGWQSLVEAGEWPASWLRTFGAGDSYLALVYGALCGLLTAVGLARVQGLLSWQASREAAFEGAKGVLTALAILWLAWALSAVTSRDLQAGAYLGQWLHGTVHVAWMPTLVFIIACLMAFATGTSWGTMGVMMPLVIPTCYAMLAREHSAVSPQDPILLAAIGSVLAGAIFGDHCSPISDTTVLSSQASGCNHVAHVATQLPYALLVGAVSIALGTVPVGWGAPVYPLLPCGMLVLVVALWIFGRPVTSDADSTASV